jgi:HSP20 family protein
MLMRTDPFRQFERLTQEALGTRLRPAFMPMDAYRSGEHFVVRLDIPGVDASAIDLTIEKNALTVTAERQWRPGESDQVVASERPQGTFSRQLFLGDGLDTERIEASYDNGVLTIRVPVAEQAKARRVEVTTGGGPAAIETRSEAA